MSHGRSQEERARVRDGGARRQVQRARVGGRRRVQRAPGPTSRWARGQPRPEAPMPGPKARPLLEQGFAPEATRRQFQESVLAPQAPASNLRLVKCFLI